MTLLHCALLLLAVIVTAATRADAGPTTHDPAAVTRCPPAGICDKAFALCNRGDEVPWCDIVEKCIDCQLDGAAPTGP